MNLDPEIMTFRNGSGVSEIVGDFDYFDTKKEFVEMANKEYSYLRDNKFTKNKDREFIKEDVREDWVKWYDRPFEQKPDLPPLEIFEDGCYSFALASHKDSFKVYVIDIQD